jgi:hypothetical protein
MAGPESSQWMLFIISRPSSIVSLTLHGTAGCVAMLWWPFNLDDGLRTDYVVPLIFCIKIRWYLDSGWNGHGSATRTPVRSMICHQWHEEFHRAARRRKPMKKHEINNLIRIVIVFWNTEPWQLSKSREFITIHFSLQGNLERGFQIRTEPDTIPSNIPTQTARQRWSTHNIQSLQKYDEDIAEMR